MVEIDLRRQTLMVVRNGNPEYVFDTSTGRERPRRVPGASPARLTALTSHPSVSFTDPNTSAEA